jgi:hypothetical protein
MARDYPEPADVGLVHNEKEWHRLCQLAEGLKRIYNTRRKLSRPGYQSRSGNDKLWWDLAVKVDKAKVDPQRFIDCQFDRWRPQYPYIQMLGAPASFIYYNTRYSGTDATGAAEVVVASNNQLAETVLRQNGGDVRAFLTDPQHPLNPVFAYCLARNSNLSDLADQLRQAASNYLKTYPHYRQTALSPYIDIPEQQET